jgi:hypothetical protein
VPFYKSLFFSILFSLAAGAALFLSPPEERAPVSSGAWGVIVTDEALPDRHIRDLLIRGGLGEPVGESSQWVFLDNFERLEMVTLDEYTERIESFDPRDDGYAAKLRSFFVAGGKRRLFIPLAGETPERFHSRISAALGDISFSAHILRRGRSPLPPALVLAAAAALTLILLRGLPDGLFLLPLWVLLCREGSAGFALSAVLAALFHTLRDPVREIFISRHYRTSRIFLRDFVPSWVLALVFTAAYTLIGIAGLLPPLILLSGIGGFAVLGAVILRITLAMSLKRGHIRFVPVRISGSFPITVSLPWFILPFAAASLGIFFLSLVQNPGPDAIRTAFAEWEGTPLVSPADYREHIRFQRSFSLLPLEDGDRPAGSYRSYVLDGRGLIAGIDDTAAESVPDTAPVFSGGDGLPSFPLAELMAFLEGYPDTEPVRYAPRELLPSAAILALSIALFLGGWYRYRKNGKLSIYIIDKRIAA